MRTIKLFFAFLLLAFFQLNAQWYLQTSNTSDNLYSIIFTDSVTGFIVGNNGVILKTTNSGQNWFALNSLTNNLLNSVYFPDSNTGYVVGNSGTILKTLNSGQTWSILNSNTLNKLFSVFFIDANLGFASGDNGIIFKTINGGINWEALNIGSLDNLYCVIFIDTIKGYCLNRNQIFKTTNAGASWNLNYQLDAQYFLYALSHIFFTDSINGYVIGGSPETANSILLKTTNGGDEWTISWVPALLGYSAFFNNVDTGYVIAYKSIYRTSDAGTTWISQSINSTNILIDVFFTDPNNGWIVGASGTILHTTNGGVTFSDDECGSPDRFSLAQNYPNPFNPNTKIKYTILNSPLNPSPYQGEGNRERFVTLKVYDILGNEVATLVNEYKSAAEYEIEFKANNNLPSGVYFYRLNAGSYVQTKKMLLIR